MSKLRTITLTGRPPVRIDEEDWPVLASATDSTHDGQVECEANVRTSWGIRVRQHEDGRHLVYAAYSFSTQYQHGRDYEARRGVLLPCNSTVDDVCRAIEEVCQDIAEAECSEGDETRWPTLAAECIADMPPEEL